MTAFRIEVIKNHLTGMKIAQNPTATNHVYFYTNDDGILTPDQRNFYERNGYLLIKNLIPDQLLDECKDRFIDICNGVVDKGLMTMMKEILKMGTEKKGEDLYNKIQDILQDEVFSKYTDHPVLLDYVQSFTGPNIMGMHSMLINKPPGTSIHPPHQDLHYFPFRPANRIVASWTAMEPVFKENGCLYVVPGTHKGSLYPHTYPEAKDGFVNKAYHGIRDETVAPEEMRVYLPMDKGDTVFFHPILVHGSGPNSTNKFRKAISCHYASSDCHYIETKGTLQENIATEVEEMGRRKGISADFKTLWYLRAKSVRGERTNL